MQPSWIETYGLWAVFIGAMFEGEAVFVAAGYAISQGYLPILPTLALAVAGATLGDHAFFLAGRTWGPRLLRKLGGMRPLRARATVLIRRWGRAAAFAMRFAYGLRAVVPLTMGASKFPTLLFTIFNGLGSVAFACIYLALGYFFGEALEEVWGRARGMEGQVLLGIVIVGALIWIIREWRIFHSAPKVEEIDEPSDRGPGQSTNHAA